MLVKILGSIDIASSAAFLMITFGMDPAIQYLIFCAGLLALKGMFVFTGDVLSFLDIFASISLFLSLFISLPTLILWIGALLLLAKGFSSFI